MQVIMAAAGQGRGYGSCRHGFGDGCGYEYGNHEYRYSDSGQGTRERNFGADYIYLFGSWVLDMPVEILPLAISAASVDDLLAANTRLIKA